MYVNMYVKLISQIQNLSIYEDACSKMVVCTGIKSGRIMSKYLGSVRNQNQVAKS